MHQIHANLSVFIASGGIGEAASWGSCFYFSGVVRQVTSDLLQSFSSCAVGATIFFLLMDQSQHTPHATAAWIGSDMGRMRNVDLQQVYNLQCYTAFTDKNIGSTSGTSQTYQRWIAKSREDLIHPRWLAGFLPSTVCNTTHTKYMCIHIYVYTFIYMYIHPYMCRCSYICIIMYISYIYICSSIVGTEANTRRTANVWELSDPKLPHVSLMGIKNITAVLGSILGRHSDLFLFLRPKKWCLVVLSYIINSHQFKCFFSEKMELRFCSFT